MGMFRSFLTQACAEITCLFYKHYVAYNPFVPEVKTSATDICFGLKAGMHYFLQKHNSFGKLSFLTSTSLPS